MALTKAARADLYAIASTPSNSVSIGANVDVHTYYDADIRLRMGRGTGTGFTTAPIFRIEGSAVVATPNPDQWSILRQFTPALGASIGAQAVSGTEAAGQTVITLAAGTNFNGGDYVFFHNATLGNSEWSHVVSIASADITVEEAIFNAQTGATARNQAEIWPCKLDLTGIYWLRLVVDGHGTGQAVIVHADFGACSGL